MRREFAKLILRVVWTPLLTLCLTGFCGCTTVKHDATYQTTTQSQTNQSELAVEANARGLQFIEQREYEQAKEAFREALKLNISYAPAHNNLGLVLAQRGKVYEAALEYAFASKLQPRATEPLINLGQLYDSVGWEKAAANEYERALTLAPSNVEAMGQLAQLYCRSSANQIRLDELLHNLVSQLENNAWKLWAHNRLTSNTNTPINPRTGRENP